MICSLFLNNLFLDWLHLKWSLPTWESANIQEKKKHISQNMSTLKTEADFCYLIRVLSPALSSLQTLLFWQQM